MNLRKLWADVRTELYGLQTIQQGCDLYTSLLDRGVNKLDLDKWIIAGRHRKDPNASLCTPEETEKTVQKLVDAGGMVSGGAALRARTGREGSRDVDIFFKGLPAYFNALFEAHMNLAIDVCLYRNEPWELFDLAAPMCAWSSNGFSCDPRHEHALQTMLCDIELGAIVHPTATLGRIAKYGELYKFKFPIQKVLMMAIGCQDKSVVSNALKHAI